MCYILQFGEILILNGTNQVSLTWLFNQHISANFHWVKNKTNHPRQFLLLSMQHESLPWQKRCGDFFRQWTVISSALDTSWVSSNPLCSDTTNLERASACRGWLITAFSNRENWSWLNINMITWWCCKVLDGYTGNCSRILPSFTFRTYP